MGKVILLIAALSLPLSLWAASNNAAKQNLQTLKSQNRQQAVQNRGTPKNQIRTQRSGQNIQRAQQQLDTQTLPPQEIPNLRNQVRQQDLPKEPIAP